VNDERRPPSVSLPPQTPTTTRIDVYIHVDTVADPRLDQILANQLSLKQQVSQMSQTLSQQLDGVTLEIQGDVATLTTGLTSLESQLAAALAGVVPGSTITQAQVDPLVAVHTGLAALVAALPPATAPTA
jgi:hypothetical protein